MANMDPYFAGHIENLVHYYEDFMENSGDPRMKNLPLMDNPLPTLFICLVYMHFCKAIGPRLMRHRKPLELRYFSVLYYFAQMALNGWIFNEYLQTVLLGINNSQCQPLDCSNGPMAERMANTCWWYFISKFMEMFDTVIFLITKKNYPVTDMHIVHHSLMPISVWAGLKFAPGNHSTLFALVNTFVHVVMYLYYMLTAIGPKSKYLQSGRKYLTGLQILQFLIVLGHQFQFAFTECTYSKGFVLWIALHGLFVFLLFADFYNKKYESGMKRIPSQPKVPDSPAKNEAVAEGEQEKRQVPIPMERTFRIWDREETENTDTTDGQRPFTLTEELSTQDKGE
ncbi:Elongation of very long chain fatty acids protein AAEL008004 [Gryllus bimaculatus]|nr:Elongation of very long chain fatty acids protein AAEL008004 [Gryllus bimaculatus]